MKATKIKIKIVGGGEPPRHRRGGAKRFLFLFLLS